MLDDLIEERVKKLGKFKKAGFDVYPASVKRTYCISEALDKFSKLAKDKKHIFIVGRITGKRVQGGVAFFDVKDESAEIQLVLKKDEIKDFELLTENSDIGDFAESSGLLFKTKKGQKSVQVKNFRIISKSLRPLPSEWHGLRDIETKLRKRYLDLLINPETRELFQKKTIFWKTVRDFLYKENFTEVWTPILEDIPGGADAEPFITHHKALERDFYLRISLELHLKRLLIGGYEKIFEIGRVFRNEGIDREHLQEFDSMEFYWAFADYNDGMKFVEALVKETVKKTTGGLTTQHEGEKINWGGKWPKIDYFSGLKKETGIDLNNASLDDLKRKAEELKLEFDRGLGKGRLIDLIYKKTLRQKLIQPCFLVGHPIEVSPLAKKDPENPAKVLRFQLVAAKTELGNGFSELNDPIDQRERFEAQMRLREKGDKEAQMLDEDFIEALEYGMPPAVGFGLSERLFAVLLDRSVRETVFFPPMKKRAD